MVNILSHNNQKKIAVINDFCGFGRCSLAVSLPIISALKIQCCPLPTSIFSNHTGFESFFCTDYSEHINTYINEWKKLDLKFDGILTGYLGSETQIDIVKNFIKTFKKETSVIVIDPVMGDNGKLYSGYSPFLAEKMSSLVPYADILTPNLTEACILTNTNYNPNYSHDSIEKICNELSKLGPSKIIISGIERGNDLENFIFEKGKKPKIVCKRKVGPCRSGTGDVFSSIISADAVNGLSLRESVEHASDFIAKTLKRTVELNLPLTDGICFEEFLTEL